MQATLNIPFAVPKEAYDYGPRSSGDVHGVVLTKPHVVELILDLAGYSPDKNLPSLRLLEPSCGHGAFLVPAVQRLIQAAHRLDQKPSTLTGCIVAFDIDETHVEITKQTLLTTLHDLGVATSVAEKLVDAWVHVGDFLLAPIVGTFDFVVGNPPYIRIEQLSPFLQAEYRRRYTAIYDRADIYVAFIERGLTLLSADGLLSFICADRWITNKYGAPLRSLISKDYGLRAYIDLHKASPFESDVIAYPSIFVMSRAPTTAVPVVSLATANEAECASVMDAISDENRKATGVVVTRYATWFGNGEPWVLSSPQHLAVLRELESKFEPIENSARVGIGVATGCDQVYIVDASADIEPDRLVPLVMRDDLQRGSVVGARRFVINTFEDDGGVVDLSAYPRLKSYFNHHGLDVRKRHVAQKNPRAWFRTIDRVYPDLVSRPKLLIPDIASALEVAFDKGEYHPHHNLYYLVSDQWNLEVLGGLLSSRVALFFVWSYAVKMRGGYLRFQAQYLRRIRVPHPVDIDGLLSQRIKMAFRNRDFSALDELALQAYGLSELPAFDFVDTRR